MKKIFPSLFFLFIFLSSKAQTDSCHFRISLLTCSPGKELYSTFGHSALRVADSSRETDVIFNYGTFDFNDPDFYKKFIRGKLLYFVSVEEFTDFVNEYREQQRGIVEQALDLSCAEKQALLAALYENAKEANKYYKYDFTYDNCTTRLRDIVAKYCSDHLVTKNILPYKNVTFRNLIHGYLNKGGQYWSKLGIDILLGSPLDKKISNNEAMFLPDYLLKGLDSSTLSGKPLVAEKKVILEPTIQFSKNKWLSPFVIFSVLFLLLAVLSTLPVNRWFFIVFDFLLFFLAGALGILLLFMWLGTDHQACRYNFNLCWALPTHFIVAFFIAKRWKWLKYYFVATIIILLSLSVWGAWRQELNPALMPVMALLLLRSVSRIFKNE